MDISAKTANRAEIFGDLKWAIRLGDEFDKDYMIKLGMKLAHFRRYKVIYPTKENLFRCFKESKWDDVKVVFVGQTPYHNGASDGLAFSAMGSDFIPKSLDIITDKLNSEILSYFNGAVLEGDLSGWAKQGVLLLNRVLSTERHSADAHYDLGWETFTDQVIDSLNNEKENLVFILCGKKAQELETRIDIERHCLITCEHPAAAARDSRAWINDNCFIKTNLYLKANGKEQIIW